MVNGQLLEPIELLIVEVPEEYVGAVMQKIGARRGELENMGTREEARRIWNSKFRRAALSVTVPSL